MQDFKSLRTLLQSWASFSFRQDSWKISQVTSHLVVRNAILLFGHLFPTEHKWRIVRLLYICTARNQNTSNLCITYIMYRKHHSVGKWGNNCPIQVFCPTNRLLHWLAISALAQKDLGVHQEEWPALELPEGTLWGGCWQSLPTGSRW